MLAQLFLVGNLIQVFNKSAEKKLGLSLVQWLALSCLAENPALSAQELAAGVGVQPSTLTQTLKRLERKGLIFVTEDPKDSRRKIIVLTRRGNGLRLESNAKVAEWSRDFAILEKSLTRVRKSLERRILQNDLARTRGKRA